MGVTLSWFGSHFRPEGLANPSHLDPRSRFRGGKGHGGGQLAVLAL
jgi:hypothetical protein